METPTDLAKLTALFLRLGARDAEGWAKSQIEEGIPQLHRYLFLRQAWTQIRTDDDCTWIGHEIAAATRQPDAPFADVGRVFAKCLEKGISQEDLASLARALQGQALHNFCYLLEDPSFQEVELDGLGWGLFELDPNEVPVGQGILGLHESVLETDPTGREARPKKTA